MTFDDYSARRKALAVYPGQNTLQGLNYVLVGMAGEVGELLNKFKKVLRGDFDRFPTELALQYTKMSTELGDVIWYADGAALELNRSLGWIAEDNIFKLEERKLRGTIQGSGDNR